MRKADIVLVVLGLLVLTATLVGALSGDRWTDERTVRFRTNPPLVLETAAYTGEADSGGVTYLWTVPPNSTSADLQVTIAFQGQAIRGGTGTVTLRVTTPDGESQPPITKPWAIAQGSTSSEVALNATIAWMEVPHTLRDTTSSAHGVVWSQPLQVVVIVQTPADLPLATYDFQTTADVTVVTYEAL